MVNTNFCCRSGGSNLNAGSRNGNTTVPGTSADFTYASGTWVQSTRTFTVASGNPSTDGVAVGDFVSVYANGATATGYVARVTSVTSTTIVTSATAFSGTAPADGTSNRTLKVGGAWLGPNGATPWFDVFPATAMTNVAGNPVFVYLKNDQIVSITAEIQLGPGDVQEIVGFTSAYGDGGLAEINGGTSGASYYLLRTASSASRVRIEGIIFNSNGATGSNGLMILQAGSTSLCRCVIRNSRGAGAWLQQGSASFIDCEIYGNNVSNTASTGGLIIAVPAILSRCMIHDNTGSNTSGIYVSAATTLDIDDCIIESNGSAGGIVISSAGIVRIAGGSFYANAGPDINLTGTSLIARIENCNFIGTTGTPGTYGIVVASGIVTIINCGFGSGTAAHATGTTSIASGVDVSEIGSITYASNITPWVDPANGDFRINLPAAQGTGYGGYLQTASGYAGTVAFPDRGSAQSIPASTGIYRRRMRPLGV